jgi:hypothetical protein
MIDYSSPGMPLTHSGRKPFVVFQTLANFEMGAVIDHLSRPFGSVMYDEGFEVDIGVVPVISASV